MHQKSITNSRRNHLQQHVKRKGGIIHASKCIKMHQKSITNSRRNPFTTAGKKKGGRGIIHASKCIREAIAKSPKKSIGEPIREQAPLQEKPSPEKHLRNKRLKGKGGAFEGKNPKPSEKERAFKTKETHKDHGIEIAANHQETAAMALPD
jgi:hypothetical protein